MVLERRTRSSVSPELEQKLLGEIEERDNRIYHPDWDFYEEMVAKAPPSGRVGVPHRVTGEMVGINLLTDTLDDIVARCGFPEHERDETLRFYRSYLLDRLRYRDKSEVPARIPLLEE